MEQKIKEGIFGHRLEETAIPGRTYITRYCLDLEVKTAATELRIYADENGKFQIPPGYKADVFYDDTIKAAAAFLYSEGVVANDRICTFINSLSGDALNISTAVFMGSAMALQSPAPRYALSLKMPC